MSSPIVVIGAGGHARAVVGLIASHSEWKIPYVIDPHGSIVGEIILGCPVVARPDVAAALKRDGIAHFALAIGDNDLRRTLYADLVSSGFVGPTIIHASAVVDASARIGGATIVGAGAILGVLVDIGEDCIINTGAILDHETKVGAHSHIAPGVRIAGRVRVGASCMIGIGSAVKEAVTIGERSIVGAGSVVVSNIPEQVVAFGVPARVVKPRS